MSAGSRTDLLQTEEFSNLQTHGGGSGSLMELAIVDPAIRSYSGWVFYPSIQFTSIEKMVSPRANVSKNILHVLESQAEMLFS